MLQFAAREHENSFLKYGVNLNYSPFFRYNIVFRSGVNLGRQDGKADIRTFAVSG